MQVRTTDDVLDMLDGFIRSTAGGAAMELGLFWRLAERPASAREAGEALGIPGNRIASFWSAARPAAAA